MFESTNATKYKNAYKKLNAIAKGNSACRNKRNLLSCAACKKYNSCKMNGYDEQLRKVNNIGFGLDSRTKLKIMEELKR